MRVLFIYMTKLGCHLILSLLNSVGRPCLVDKFFKICNNFPVKLLDVFFKQLFVPAFCSFIVLIDMEEIETNLKNQVHKLLHVIDVWLEFVSRKSIQQGIGFVFAQLTWFYQRGPKVLHLFGHKDDLYVWLLFVLSLLRGLFFLFFKVMLPIYDISFRLEAWVWLSWPIFEVLLGL